MKKPIGTQLRYIKAHFAWLIGLSLGGVILFILFVWGLVEFFEFKTNYRQFWIDKGKMEIEVKRLGMERDR